MVNEIAKQEAEENAQVPYDAGDPKAVNNARKKSARIRANSRAVLARIMSDPGVRSWLYDWLTECEAFCTTYEQGSPDGTAFREGKRQIGLMLMADMTTAAPEHFNNMIREGLQEGKRPVMPTQGFNT